MQACIGYTPCITKWAKNLQQNDNEVGGILQHPLTMYKQNKYIVCGLTKWPRQQHNVFLKGSLEHSKDNKWRFPHKTTVFVLHIKVNISSNSFDMHLKATLVLHVKG